MDYFIRINEDISFNISGIDGFEDIYRPLDEISEHFHAQLEYMRTNGVVSDKFEPIIIAVDKDRFESIIKVLRKKTGVDMSFVKSIPITVKSDGGEVIRVINSSNIN